MPNRLRELRKAKGLTLVEFSDLVHINKSSLARYEIGDVSIKADTLQMFADFYGVTTDYILGISDNVNKNIEIKDQMELLEGYDFYQKLKGLSSEEIKEVESYIEFLKSKKEGKTNES